jgi:tetratricopeptide (TPR) repeat protein
LAALLAGSGFTSCHADAAADNVAESALLKKAEAMRVAQPEAAIAELQQFAAAHPQLNPERMSLLDIAISGIYFDDLKAPEKAIAAIDTGLARSDQPYSYLPLTSYKINYLARSDRHAEAIALFQKELPKLIAEPTSDFAYLRGALNSYELSARKAGKQDEFIATLRRILTQQPQLVAYRVPGARVVDQLVNSPGKEAEALSWAKLYWMTCDFDETSINDATALLQKAWVAKDTNTAKSMAFLKALQDSAAPNPLKDVPLPPLDEGKLRESLKTLPANSLHSRITLLLLLGEDGNAMLEARRLLLDDPAKGTVAAREMARVFKASDLSLVRANAFLQYFQTSQGANPLDEFFKEHPVK